MQKLLAPIEPPHAFGTKRPSLESSYFEVFNQPNTSLIDLKSTSIMEITPEGILTSNGILHKLDVIIFATGYDFGVGSQLAIETVGLNGLSLRQKWGMEHWPYGDTDEGSDGVHTYLGIMCAGFPNMLLSCGPQAPTACGITPRLSELQGDWIVDCIDYVRQTGQTITTTEEAERDWKIEVQQAADITLILQTDGWYMGNNIAGRKKEPLFWFGNIPQYMDICHKSAGAGYVGFIIK